MNLLTYQRKRENLAPHNTTPTLMSHEKEHWNGKKDLGKDLGTKITPQ